jgi:hypothetical protein
MPVVVLRSSGWHELVRVAFAHFHPAAREIAVRVVVARDLEHRAEAPTPSRSSSVAARIVPLGSHTRSQKEVVAAGFEDRRGAIESSRPA